MNRQEKTLNAQQHKFDRQSDDHETSVDTKTPVPAKNQEPHTDQQTDQEFSEAVEQRIADNPQNAGQDDSRTSQPALQEDEDSLAKPRNS